MNEWLQPGWEGFRQRDLRPAEPLGAKAVKKLRELRLRDGNWNDACAQHESLRRRGYVRHTNDCDGNLAQITNAGLAALARLESVA